MPEKSSDRRSFLAVALPMLAAVHVMAAAPEPHGPEVPNFWFEIPPKTTFWGVVMFLGEDPIEVSIATRKDSKVMRGRFDAQRLVEFSWKNKNSDTERVAFRGKALAGDIDLPISGVRGIVGAEGAVMIGFGRRGTPDKSARRLGSYRHEAALIGFVVYGDV
jgi:hypothetical protein